MKATAPWIIAVTALSFAGSLRAATITLVATDSNSISQYQPMDRGDNLLAVGFFIIGWVGYIKFDLSVIPDSAEITGLTLTAYNDTTYSMGSTTDPTITVFRSSVDTWSRAVTNDPFPGVAEQLSSPLTSFPSAPGAAISWILDVNAFDYETDLADNVFSVGLKQTNPAVPDRYMNFSGVNNPLSLPGPPAPSQYTPRLEVTYNTGISEPSSALLLLSATSLWSLRRRKPAIC